MKFNVRSMDIPLSSPLSLYYAANVFLSNYCLTLNYRKKPQCVNSKKK